MGGDLREENQVVVSLDTLFSLHKPFVVLVSVFNIYIFYFLRYKMCESQSLYLI